MKGAAADFPRALEASTSHFGPLEPFYVTDGSSLVIMDSSDASEATLTGLGAPDKFEGSEVLTTF